MRSLMCLCCFLWCLNFWSLCRSLVCYSQLCLDEQRSSSCSALATCRATPAGYCYTRVFVSHNQYSQSSSSSTYRQTTGNYGGMIGAAVRGIESGCSTEFTSLMLGRCAGDLADEEYTCVCATNLCNGHFLNGSVDENEKPPADNFSLRRILCLEDDRVKCEQQHQQIAPCNIDGRTYCGLIRSGASPQNYRLHRASRIGYWPMFEYAHLAVREIACIQGLAAEDNVIECYCKWDNCNSVKEGGAVVKVRVRTDQDFPLTRCLMESRFYSADEVTNNNNAKWSGMNNESSSSSSSSSVEEDEEESETLLPPLSCLGHSCYTTYERDTNSTSRPSWIRVMRGCVNFSRPTAFSDHSMDSEFGPRARGTRLCRAHLCNNVSVRRLANPKFLFSRASRRFGSRLEKFVRIIILLCVRELRRVL